MSTLRGLLDKVYSPRDYPALDRQARQWQRSKALEGVRLLDATPVFGNTLAKYLPLLEAGADLTVALSPLLPHDPATAQALKALGIPVVSAPDATFDVVMDCAGVLSHVTGRAGYVELTKTGEHVYRDCPQPAILVDDSRSKHIETSLGTGDGFVRALAHFGFEDLEGRSVVVFGAGKVGRGAALRARQAGARVTVIDPRARVAGCDTANTPAQIDAAIDGAWCIVTATGVAGALALRTEQLHASGAILANLGAEDEYGHAMPADRVLNAKLPVNFALPEPTRLRYLDATMALVNACALALISDEFPPGLNPAPRALDDEILAVTRDSGLDLSALEELA